MYWQSWGFLRSSATSNPFLHLLCGEPDVAVKDIARTISVAESNCPFTPSFLRLRSRNASLILQGARSALSNNRSEEMWRSKDSTQLTSSSSPDSTLRAWHEPIQSHGCGRAQARSHKLSCCQCFPASSCHLLSTVSCMYPAHGTFSPFASLRSPTVLVQAQ